MIEKIRHMAPLLAADLPNDGYAVVHSAWLTLMGLRPNGDLDLIMASSLKQKMFDDPHPDQTFGLPGPYEKRIRIQPMSSPYGDFYGASGIDDVIENFCVVMDGVRFVEPRFYFEFKKRRIVKFQERQRSLPWHRRVLALPNGQYRSWGRKIDKDRADFAWLNAFFDKNGHRQPHLRHVPDKAWGLPGREWQPDR